MPIYEYECRKCGIFEYSQSITEDPLKRCPACRSAVTKLLSAGAFHLRGGGWYSDGYQKKAADKAGSGSNGSGGKSKPADPKSTKVSTKDGAAAKSTDSSPSPSSGSSGSKSSGNDS
jgi:putative FmdB family regulatory protein